jgi:hypothetical protein
MPFNEPDCQYILLKYDSLSIRPAAHANYIIKYNIPASDYNADKVANLIREQDQASLKIREEQQIQATPSRHDHDSGSSGDNRSSKAAASSQGASSTALAVVDFSSEEMKEQSTAHLEVLSKSDNKSSSTALSIVVEDVNK